MLLVVWVLGASSAEGQPTGRRRALLVGINDYSASRLGLRSRHPPPPGRDWPNLTGAVNDVGMMAEMLTLLYGFDPSDIVTLTDQAATRTAILQAIERQLVNTAARDDVQFFYFAGHGSQVRNSLSEEPDKLDESLVPADSRIGVPDIRDKELARLFYRIVDRGARLTVLFDNCHSGSGARGLSAGARFRSVKRDPRDVADGATPGLPPEARGAVVLAAAQDFDAAWETRDEQGRHHGAFSWAFLRAMRDALPGEPVMETFLRAQARLRAETPFQEPVISGNPEPRLRPFLGVRTDYQGPRPVIAVEKVRSDGTVVLQGGWANGLSLGSELRVVTEREITARVRVTALQGLGRSEARIETGRALPQAVRSGALMEIVGWAAPPGRPLRVWTPRVSGGVGNISALARRLMAETSRRGVRWVTDPVEVTPMHLLRRRNDDWELLGASGEIERLGSDAGALAAVAKIPAGSSLFVQLPAPAALIDGIAVGPGTDREGVEPVAQPEEADYILVGRFAAHRLEYAWVRPSTRSTDRRKTGLPLRTDWIAENGRDRTLRDSVAELRRAVLALRRIHGWHFLESPPEARSAYRLALRRARDRDVVKDAAVIGDEDYELVLRAAAPLPARVPQRFFYAFVIDGFGKSTLLFPQTGSVENRFPLGLPAPAQINLGTAGSFEIAPPYGVDSYFLLTTDEPLPNPWILQWDGIRTRAPEAPTPLEQLLLLTGSETRSSALITPTTWSIEKVVFESVPPRTSPKMRKRSGS